MIHIPGHRKDRHRTSRHLLKLYRKRLYRQFTQAPIIDRLILLIGATSLVWYVIIYRPEQESESDPQLIAEPSSYIRSAVAEMNALQKIHNEHLYGPLRENDLVIVIQVHNRWSYLAGLISSLESVLHINRTLLIFSHDVYDEEGFVETLPKNVTFAKMMQIFYPNSIQLEPNRFPGDHPDDCPRNLPQHLAEEVGCQNSRYPDIHGHYREGKFCQTKHHWWWKINRIMDGLNVTMSHRGPFMFLEEDHYVVPDLIHMLRGLETVQPTFCPTCRMFVMGTYVKANLFSTLSAGITKSRWVSSKHNMGMVIYRDLWRSIRDNCSQDFCTYDDYNWDFSLYKATLTCLGEPLEAMVLRATRVYHVGECGVHHKGE